MLEIRGVKKVYETGGIKRTALNRVSVNFRTSEFAAILGPSGSGKTTLLNIIGGLDHYTNGDLIIDGRSTKQFKDKDWDTYRNHRIGFVFQSYNLIPHQTVLQNVRLALTLSGISKKDSYRRAKRALKEVGLSEHLDKRPAQLSGGQMQRVAIARALVNDPDIVLADEPTGALDSTTSVQIMDILKKISQDKLVVMVTHNPDLAKEYSTRIITLSDGKITSDSDPYTETDDETNVASTSVKSTTSTKSAKTSKPHTHKSNRRTNMSYLTALSLSLKNLLTKKARTILVSIAGSIGIIGIALISAVSTGFQNYIDTIEEDTLTSYPLTLMEESADLTGVLLSITDTGDTSNNEHTVKENQVLTGALGNVSHNDLESFMNYLDAHKSDTNDDVRLIEKQYNIDPLIYTIDQTGDLAKLNPSNLFSTLIGDTSMLSSYSSLTSVFQQHDLENMQQDSKLLTGHWPENYDEVVLSLRDPAQIPDLMTYSLGFHDTNELNDILAKILNGEPVNTKSEPLELSYDDLMNVDLRLIPSTDTYKFNEKYNVYEDMTDDDNYMRDLYNNHSEKLKIVGIVTPKGDMAATGNGVFYLPSLITHIIEKSQDTEIVQKQLANPETNIFSNSKFGEEKDDFDFEFADLVAVDNDAIKQAFGITIDQNTIAATTREYIGSISSDIDTGTAQVPAVRDNLTNSFRTLATNLKDDYTAYLKQNARECIDKKKDGEECTSEADNLVGLLAGLKDPNSEDYKNIVATIQSFGSNYINNTFLNNPTNIQLLSGLESSYGLPTGSFTAAYSGFLQGWWFFTLENSLSEAMFDASSAGGLGNLGSGATGSTGTPGSSTEFPGFSPENNPVSAFDANSFLNNYLAQTEVSAGFDAIAVPVAEIYLKQTILTKIGNLTSYLSSTFADAFHLDQNALLGAFKLNFTQDELTRVVTAMFNEKQDTLNSNLSTLGYQNINHPTRIAFYFTSFDGKTHFMQFLDHYNDLMNEAGKDDKVIEYSDTTGALMSSVKVIVDAVSYVLIAFVSISLIVSSIMIGVITYISVYERTKEIGILRAIGASKHNISSIFNAETFIIGLLAGIFAIIISYALIPIINAVLHHFTGDIPLSAALAPTTALTLIALSIVLTLIGGLIPAHSASKKDPVEALRSE